MKNRTRAGLLALALMCVWAGDLFVGPPLRAAEPPIPEAIANENKVPAGTLTGQTLELNLDVRLGFVRPEGDGNPKLTMPVFGEVGKPPQNPGPLIRVPEGTTAHVSVHNTLKKLLVVHGLRTRPEPDGAVLNVPAGETRDVRFVVGTPGTYYYWASSSGAEDYAARGDTNPESQLVGAFVVDPAGGREPDRVFVMNLINIPGDEFHEALGTFIVNGRSWPYTERLTYRAGEHARWRWINLSGVDHPMHLHGAYFGVVAVGDGVREEVYKADARRQAVTEFLEDGHTMTVDWVPERAGRWMFHCHLLPHFTPDNQLPRVTYPEAWGPEFRDAPAAAQPGHDHAGGAVGTGAAGMAGLVMLITVEPGSSPTASVPASGPVRRLELTARPQTPPTGNTATLGFDLREGGRDLDRSGLMPGPPIVLTQHQPVEVSIVNHLPGPTAVHWHGIELESYYDGVADLGGAGPQVTPPIAAGATFVAKFTPPRAGTFIYHSHWHDLEQLTKGLYGPLIILPPGRTFDPETDKVVLLSIDGPKQNKDDLLVNGTKAPAPMQLRVGTTYRWRLINITADNPDLTISLLSGDAPVEWRAVAKDGADLPESQRKVARARQLVSVGETYDFEFVPVRPGALTLDVVRPGNGQHVITPIDVR